MHSAELQALTAQLQQGAPKNLTLGLGSMTWELLTREVGDWHRFRNRRQVASYTGLCPRTGKKWSCFTFYLTEHPSLAQERQHHVSRMRDPAVSRTWPA